MKTFDWFKGRIGKSVVAYPKGADAIGSLHVRDEKHAEHLFGLQETSEHEFSHYDDDSATLTPIIEGILIGEMFSDSSPAMDISSSPDISPSTDFGGGDFGGGGASADFS